MHKILWKGKGKINFFFAGMGFLIGFFMLLLAVHLYKNVFAPINTEIKSEQSSAYLIINKKVNLTNSLGLIKTYFSEREIENLNQQSFIKRVGVFSSNQFKASVSMQGVGGSDLPIESVEEIFLDTIPQNWNWHTNDAIVPIILSNEFINLYNFVMAPSWGTPQIPKETINQFKLDLHLSGNGKSSSFKTHVAGFSDRIVSVLVPQSFMDWANAEFGNGVIVKPNRIILEVSDPSDTQLLNYLDKNGYETNRDKLKSSAKSFVSILILVVSIFGLLIFLLAIFLFVTTFSLLIAEQKNDIGLLFQIGYGITVIHKIWASRFIKWMFVLFVLSILLLLIINYVIVNLATQQGLTIEKNISYIVYISGIILLSVVLIYNWIRIKTSLTKIYQ
ncbi:MAG: hypothetical protein H7Y00_16850 [Fimbriimonadaceae bacterium]|nr:hypothetical protein [Chitinophagales bacterium]